MKVDALEEFEDLPNMTVTEVSTVQYSTVQYSTVQYSTVQHSTVQYSTVHLTGVRGRGVRGRGAGGDRAADSDHRHPAGRIRVRVSARQSVTGEHLMISSIGKTTSYSREPIIYSPF